MPKRAAERSAAELRAWCGEVERGERRPGLHPVGGVAGLNLNISRTGAAGWTYRVTVRTRRADGTLARRRRWIGLGTFPDVSLSDARAEAKELRRAVRAGRDPVAEREQARRADEQPCSGWITFRDAARECHRIRSSDFRSDKHRDDWWSSIERYVLPCRTRSEADDMTPLGARDVADVSKHDVKAVLEQSMGRGRTLWHDRTETATRVRQRVASVLEWAIVAEWRRPPNPALWDGNLEWLLDRPARLSRRNGGAKKQHQPRIAWQRMPAFMAALRRRDGIAARALEFKMATAARSGEVRHATWSEIDLDQRVWRVPADRMKSGRAHVVPLPDDAVTLLRALPRMAGSDYVFTATRGGALSDMAISQLVKRMHDADVRAGGSGWTDPDDGRRAVPHGLARTCFREWVANARGHYTEEAAELALAHVNSDSTRAAYQRNELIDERRDMMADWAAFLRGEGTA